MQYDFGVPSSATTTWLCSQTISGKRWWPIDFDRVATVGSVSRSTVYVRSMRNLGIGGIL